MTVLAGIEAPVSQATAVRPVSVGRRAARLTPVPSAPVPSASVPLAPVRLAPVVRPRPSGGRHRLRPPGRPVAVPAAVRRTLVARCRAQVADKSAGWLISAALGLCVAGWVVFAVLSWSPAPQGEPVPDRTVVVQVRAGENLTGLARRAAPGSDPAAVVARIRALNNMAGSDLMAGQPLVVPAAPGFAESGTAG